MSQQHPMTRENLPALTSQLADERVLATFMLPPEEAKIKFQMAPLIMLARDNPDLQATDFISFIRLAQKTGADPERKHIHLITTRKKIKRFDQVQNRQVEEWVTKGEAWFAYHFFVAKAQETGELTLMDVVTEPCDYLNPATGQLIKNTIKSTSTIIRKNRVTGVEQKYIYRAFFPEFVKTKEIWSNGQATGQFQVTEAWMHKPYMMNEKCSLANALRWAFEAELAGMYIPEEMSGEMSPMPVTHSEPAAPTAPALNAAPAVQVIDATEPQVAPAVELESQDTEYHELGQPEPEHEAAAPAVEEAPKQTLVEKIEEKAQGRVASSNTKGRLWKAVMDAGKKGILNPTDAGTKLKTVTVTEALAEALMQKLASGDAAWFHNQ